MKNKYVSILIQKMLHYFTLYYMMKTVLLYKKPETSNELGCKELTRHMD